MTIEGWTTPVTPVTDPDIEDIDPAGLLPDEDDADMDLKTIMVALIMQAVDFMGYEGGQVEGSGLQGLTDIIDDPTVAAAVVGLIAGIIQATGNTAEDLITFIPAIVGGVE